MAVSRSVGRNRVGSFMESVRLRNALTGYQDSNLRILIVLTSTYVLCPIPSQVIFVNSTKAARHYHRHCVYILNDSVNILC